VIHERIAEALGWTVKETQGFSLAALKEFVRVKDPVLAQDIAVYMQTGRHITC
jgi:hypothetical protein